MIVTTYIQPNHIVNPTGVGKHVINMPLELSRIDGVDLRVVCASREYRECVSAGSAWPFTTRPTTLLPGRRRAWEMAWRALGHPRIDRWVQGTDWLYSPATAYIPSRRVPVAITIHCIHWFEKDYFAYGSAAYRKSRLRWSTILKPALRSSRLVFVVSEYLKTKVHEIFSIPRQRIIVVGNGVEDVFFRPAPPMDPAGFPSIRSPYVVIVGGLTLRKGGDYVLAVARSLAKQASSLQIVVVGKSHEEFRLAAEHVPGIVHVGYVGVDRLPTLLHGARALLCLSRHETFGIPVAEAMAVGTPVVSSRYTALPEIVGDAGILVDATAADDVAATLIDLDRDESMRRELIDKGTKRAATMTWRVCAERVHAALRESSGSVGRS
jgi:glycosyltransferase involved in cell wall biosynthesis